MARIKVAVVGTGAWGEQHARVFASRSDTELVGVAGRDPNRTRSRADQFGTRAYTVIDELLETEQPDLVSVCLPNEDHFPLTLELLQRDMPLLVEKPLVFDLAEADRLLQEAATRGLFFAINFNHRYAEPVRRARKLIDEHLLGDIVFATWRFGGEANTGRSPDRNLIETQCHGLDMLEYLCGPITAVTAQFSQVGDPTSNNTVASTMSLASGAVATFLGSYESSYAYPRTHQLEVNGLQGRLVVDDTIRRLTVSMRGDETRQVWEAGYFNDEARTFVYTFDRHVDDLLDALRAGDSPPIPAAAGRRALVLANAIITSAHSGQRVETVPLGP